MGQYANNCVEMLLREDSPRRPGRAGTYIFGQEFKDQEYFRESPVLIEYMPITGNYMMMNGFPQEIEKKIFTMPDGHKGGPYPKYNRNADKLMSFYGTDTDNMRDLGAHIEFHLGEGADEETFHFDEPRCIFVPKGVRHGPIYITGFRCPLIMVCVFTQNSKSACDIVNDWNYVGNDEKIKEVIQGDMELYKSFYAENPK